MPLLGDSPRPEFHLTTPHQWGSGRGVPDHPASPPQSPPPFPPLNCLDQILLRPFGAILHCVVGVADCTPHMPLFPVFFLSFCWASYCLFAFTDFRQGLEITPLVQHCMAAGGSWADAFLGWPKKCPPKFQDNRGGADPLPLSLHVVSGSLHALKLALFVHWLRNSLQPS